LCRIEFNKLRCFLHQNPVEKTKNNQKALKKNNQSKRNNLTFLLLTTIKSDPLKLGLMTQSNRIKKPFFYKNYSAEGHPAVWDQPTMNQAGIITN